MTPAWLLRHAIEPALELLPWKMGQDAARPMLLAIALQESRIKYRRQIGGAARGFWQFEMPGVVEVMTNRSTRHHIDSVVGALAYDGADATDLWEAIEHNDILAAAFARCLLWTLPDPLPGRDDHREGWRQYLAAWRPGRPHPETWERFYREAWEVVEG